MAVYYQKILSIEGITIISSCLPQALIHSLPPLQECPVSTPQNPNSCLLRIGFSILDMMR